MRKWGELVYQWVRHCGREIRARRRSKLVLGSVERAGHRLLAGHAGGVPQALRLRRRRSEARAADGAHRRAAHDRAGEPARRVPARLPRALPARHELRDGQTGSPLDYVGFHAKGAPACWWTATSGWASRNQLQAITNGFAHRRLVPRIRGTPVIIGESDPEGCAACSVTRQPAERLPQRHDVFQLHGGAIARALYELADLHGVNSKGR